MITGIIFNPPSTMWNFAFSFSNLTMSLQVSMQIFMFKITIKLEIREIREMSEKLKIVRSGNLAKIFGNKKILVLKKFNIRISSSTQF